MDRVIFTGFTSFTGMFTYSSIRNYMRLPVKPVKPVCFTKETLPFPMEINFPELFLTLPRTIFNTHQQVISCGNTWEGYKFLKVGSPLFSQKPALLIPAGEIIR